MKKANKIIIFFQLFFTILVPFLVGNWDKFNSNLDAAPFLFLIPLLCGFIGIGFDMTSRFNIRPGNKLLLPFSVFIFIVNFLAFLLFISINNSSPYGT